MFFSSEHREVLTDPQTWNDNPFVLREARRDRKRWQPLISFSWMCGVLLWTGGLGFYLLTLAQQYLHHIPWFLGGDLGTALCIIVSGIQIFFIAGAAQKHTTRLLTSEANQNTLSSLLTLPSSNFQLIVQLTAYPWLVGMRMAVFFLPVYVFCVGIDGLSWLDLVMLYVVFAANAFSVPFWIRPALSENLAIVTTTKKGQPIGDAGQVAKQARSSTNTTGGGLAIAFLIPLFSFIYAIISRKGLGGTYEGMERYLPESVISLLTSSFISWPLMAARLLVSPIDWFGFNVMPIFFFAPLFFLHKYCQIVRTSEFLSVGSYRELAKLSTYLPRKRMESMLSFVRLIVVLGYLWKWGVWDGAFSVVSVKVAGAAPGLAGFGCCLLLIYGILGGIKAGSLGVWLHSPVMKAENPIVRRSSLTSSLLYMILPFISAIALFLICCFISRTDPFPHLLRGNANLSSPLFAILMIGLTGAILSFGVSRLFGMASVWVRIAVLTLIVLIALLQSSQDFLSWAASTPQTKSLLTALPALQKIEILSPLSGILHVIAPNWTNFNLFLPHSPVWTQWALAGAIVGGAMSLLGCLLLPRASQIKQAGERAVILDPTVIGMEAFADPAAFKNDVTNKQDTPIVIYAVKLIQKRFDNGIIVKELRTKLRGKWEAGTIIVAWVMIVGLTLCLFHPYVSPFSQAMGGVLSSYLGNNSALAATMAGILILWHLLAGILTFAFSFSTTNLFFLETQKSTLSFLLTTPMKNGEILFGKVVGALVPSGALLGALYLWTLLLSVCFIPLLGIGTVVMWAILTSSFVIFYLTMNLVITAVASVFPRLSLAQAGWIWAIIFYFSIFPLIWVISITSVLLYASGLGPYGIWISIVCVLLIVSLLSVAIAMSGISAMRKKDFSEGTNKRSG